MFAVKVTNPGFVDRFVKRGAFAEHSGKVDVSGYGYTNEPGEIWSHRDEILARQVAELFRKAAGPKYTFTVVREKWAKVREWEEVA